MEIGNTLARVNELIADHREWLAKFSEIQGRMEEEGGLPTRLQPPTSLITPAPSLHHRAAYPAPIPQIPQIVPAHLCDPQISVISASMLASFSAISAAAVQSVQLASQSLASAISVERSISPAAAISNGIANSVVNSRVSSASIAAALSASSAIQAAVNSADSAVAAAQAIASAAVNSANLLAADAKATGTFATAQAEATISKVNIQASASVLASQMMSKTETRFALALAFSIIGSSLVSILAYFLLSRYRKRRKLAKEGDLVQRSTRYSQNPSLSEFPHSRKSEWSFVERAEPQRIGKPHPGIEVTLPDEPPRAFSNPHPVLRPDRDERIGEWEGPRPSLERKNTLICDAERPEQPPKSKSLLVESLRSVGQLENRISKNLKAVGDSGKRSSMQRSSGRILDDEGTEIGTAL